MFEALLKKEEDKPSTKPNIYKEVKKGKEKEEFESQYHLIVV